MNTDVTLRPTVEGDIAAISAIYADAVLSGTASFELEPPSEAEMARRWRDLAGSGFPHLVAERAGHVAGYAYAGPYRPRRAYRFAVEDSIYLAANSRGLGLGRLLLAELIALSEAGGFRQMIAVIGGGAENRASVALHSALGFRLIGTFEGAGFKHGRWLDSVLMQRPLGPGNAVLPEDR
jgi:phosphinothricin acetyltransferase